MSKEDIRNLIRDKKAITEFACNPVGKLGIIISLLTHDNFLQRKLLEVLSRELSVEEIEKLWHEVVIKSDYILKNKQLKLEL